MTLELHGRHIESAQFRGLIENLCRISLLCHSAEGGKDRLDKESLLIFITQITQFTTEAMIFSNASNEEINHITRIVLSDIFKGDSPIN